LEPNIKVFYSLLPIQDIPYQQVKGPVGEETLMRGIVLLLQQQKTNKQHY